MTASVLFFKPSTAKGAIDGFTHGSLRPRSTSQRPRHLQAFDTQLRCLTLAVGKSPPLDYRPICAQFENRLISLRPTEPGTLYPHTAKARKTPSHACTKGRAFIQCLDTGKSVPFIQFLSRDLLSVPMQTAAFLAFASLTYCVRNPDCRRGLFRPLKRNPPRICLASGRVVFFTAVFFEMKISILKGSENDKP